MMHVRSRGTRAAIAVMAILLAAAVLTLPASLSGAKNLPDAFLAVATQAKIAAWESYRLAPALTLGLLLAAVLPALAIGVRVLKPFTSSSHATRRYRPGRDDKFDADIAAVFGYRRRHPFVEIENGRGLRCAILRDMLRIGREDDNDIQIPSRYVHRYHAAIHREDFGDWRITDLSGVESNGLIVNGKRCCEARLNDGDVIQLGPGKLRFRSGGG